MSLREIGQNARSSFKMQINALLAIMINLKNRVQDEYVKASL